MGSESLVVIEGDCFQRVHFTQSLDDFMFYLLGVLARQFIDGSEQGCSIGHDQQCRPISFTHDQVSFKITKPFPFCNDFWTFVNWHPVGSESAAVLIVATLAYKAAMAEFSIQELVLLVDAFIGVLSGPDVAIACLMSHSLDTLFSPFSGYQFRSQSSIRHPCACLLL